MGKALYRKYRPISLETVVGQDSVIKPLSEAIKTDKFSHAYVFTGPRGCGKTSVARIFAHEINNFKYELEDSYVDIIEIDGASNNGVDNIRELREKAMIAPTEGKYKVYIIDEVHMLTKSAFNALLKVLEEPPVHVVFILATTNPEKLPVTITSRSQIFHFKLADKEVMKKHLKMISEKENIKISDDAIDIIVSRGGGSFRDSISLLDQISGLANDKEITSEDVDNALGLPSSEMIKQILQKYEEDDNSGAIEILKELLNSGSSAETIASNIIDIIIDNPTPKTLCLVSKLFTVSYPFAEAKLLVAILDSSYAQPSATQAITTGTKKPDFVVKREQKAAAVRNIRDEIARRVSDAKKNEKKPEAIKEAEQHDAMSLTDSVIQDGKLNVEAFLSDIHDLNLQVSSSLKKSSYKIINDSLDIYTEKKVDHRILTSARNFEIIKKAAPGYRIIIRCAEEDKVPDDAIMFSSGEIVDSNTQEKISKISDIMGKGVSSETDSPF